MKNKGVTIIELGVVIALIGLITVLLSPLVKIARKKTCRIRCVNNLQKISLALREYALENDEKRPMELSLIYTQGYVDNEDIFDCPFSPHIGNAKDPDYIYVKEYDFNLAENPVIIYDKEGNHTDESLNALYLNGKIVRKRIYRLSKKPGTMAE